MKERTKGQSKDKPYSALNFKKKSSPSALLAINERLHTKLTEERSQSKKPKKVASGAHTTRDTRKNSDLTKGVRSNSKTKPRQKSKLRRSYSKAVLRDSSRKISKKNKSVLIQQKVNLNLMGVEGDFNQTCVGSIWPCQRFLLSPKTETVEGRCISEDSFKNEEVKIY